MRKFTLGAIAGATSLALAVPIFAQLAAAQTATTDVAVPTAPSQACLEAQVSLQDLELSNFDTKTAPHSSCRVLKEELKHRTCSTGWLQPPAPPAR